MKQIYLLLSIISTVILNVPAQNAHWSYGIPTPGIIASSAVTVILSNGSAYIAQTQSGTSNIHLSEIDPATMAATGTSPDIRRIDNSWSIMAMMSIFQP